MQSFQITSDDISGLTNSLNNLSGSLPANQAALLKAIIGFSKQGFTQVTSNLQSKLGPNNLTNTQFTVSVPENKDLSNVMREAFTTQLASGIMLQPGSPVEDSIGVSVECVSWSKDLKIVADQEQLQLLNDTKVSSILSQIRGLRANVSNIQQ